MQVCFCLHLHVCGQDIYCVYVCICLYICISILCTCMPRERFHSQSAIICVCQSGGTIVIYESAHTFRHCLSVVVFLDPFPSTLLNHENEIDSLLLKDGTAYTNKSCQLPWHVSTDNGLEQPNGTDAMPFLSK